jgi:predicted permease
MLVLHQVLVMFLLIAVGFLCYKIRMLDEEGTQTLANIVIYIANPAVLFVAFQNNSGDLGFEERLAGLGYSLLLSFMALAIACIIAFTLISSRGKRKKKAAVEQLSLIATNCGFMGIPLVRGVFGDEGVFYLAAFIAVNNLAIWSIGVIKMQGGRFRPIHILQTLKSPSIIGIILGLLVFLTRFELPALVLEPIGYAADLTTPLAMLTAGATMASVNFREMIQKIRILYISFLRLLIIPLLSYTAFLLIPATPIVLGTILAAAACPTATMCVILAVKYDGDSVYASEIFAATTLLSIISLPVVMLLPF